ncbi:hypothetical protein EMCRGX_G024169 [Ephydatia muelleri]
MGFGYHKRGSILLRLTTTAPTSPSLEVSMAISIGAKCSRLYQVTLTSYAAPDLIEMSVACRETLQDYSIVV